MSSLSTSGSKASTTAPSTRGVPLVLVDLEETLIESWNEPFFLPSRVAKVRAALDARPDAELGLMSWAVYDDRDMEVFTRTLQADVERLLGREFSPRWRLSLDNWAVELLHQAKKKLPREELFDVFGKADVFMALGRSHAEWKNREVMLFDDAFESFVLEVPARNNRIELVNVKTGK